MKKSAFWILTILLVLTTLFVACDDTDDPQPPSGSTEQTTAASDDGTTAPGTEDTNEPGTEPHVHAFGDWTTIKDATCTENGEQQRTCECGEVETQGIDALGHTEVVDAAVAPTCTATGLTEGKHCSVCNEVLVAQEVVDALGHAPGAEATCIDPQNCTVCGEQLASANGHTPGAEPTCTENQPCLVCGIELSPALGHTEVVDMTVAPDCINTGLTEGSHCEVCGEILVAQETVDALGHTEGEVVVENNVDPDCVNNGSYDNVVYCTVCNTELSRETIVVDALGHTEVIDAAVTATCTTTGMTEGSHCDVCGETLVAQEVVDALGHKYDAVVSVPTCIEAGYTTYTCSVCGDTYIADEVSALGHTEVIDAAVAATCTATGLTEGKHCDVCGEVLAAQEEIPAVGHNYEAVITAPTCTEGGYTTYTCSGCGDAYIADEVAAIGHACGVCQPSDEKWHVAICERCSTEIYSEHSFINGICTFCNYTNVIAHVSFDECDAWIGEDRVKAFFNPGQHTAWDNVAKVGLDIEYIRVWGWVGFYSETVGEFGYQIGDNEPVYSSDFYFETEQAVIEAAATILAKSASRMKIMIPVADLNGEYTVKALVRDAEGNVATLVEFTLIKTEESDNPEIPDQPDIPDEPEMPVIPEGENWIVDPRTLPAGCITGHMPDIVTKENHPSHYLMIQAAKLKSGAMLHQGSIYLGEVDLSNYGKVIIYFASDWSEFTQEGLAAAKEQGFGMIGLTGYDCNNIMNPNREDFIAKQYTPDDGWKITAHEVDLTGIDYSGPVYISADFLETQFIIIDRIEFIWGEQETPDEPQIPDEPDTPDDPDTPDEPTDKVSEGLTYELNEDGTGYIVIGIGTCTDTDIVIPETYEGLPVTGIGSRAFMRCVHLTSITIPDSVTNIGETAFRNCTGLTSITIPNGVMSIDSGAFKGCTGLTSITISDSVVSIAKDSFAFCTGLTSIAVAQGNPKYHSQGNCLIETESKVLILGCKTSVIPADGSVTGIGDAAFIECSGLTSITIPDSVTSIGNQAFENCTGLTSITIPDSVTSIGVYAFCKCTGLTSITIPDTVDCINLAVFSGCTGLTCITIPNSVTSIFNKAFDGCRNLTDVYYTGTEEEWGLLLITIGSNNTRLINATIHFNSESSEPEPDDPQAPVFVLNATYIAKAALEGFSPNHIASAILSGDASFVTLTSSDGGDPYFYLYSPSDGIKNKGARYIVIKYRTTVEGASGEFFVGSGAGPKGGSDEAVFSYITDGEWHLAIADLSTVSAVNENYVLNYLRYDPYLDGQYQSIDVAYIAAFHSVEAAEKHFEQSMSEEQPDRPDTPEIPDEPHEHAFGDWTTVKDATCIENGEQQRSCDCGEVETQIIDAFGHTEVIDPAVTPTETETGLTEGSHCAVCEAILVAQKVVPTLGHYSNPEAYSNDYGYMYFGTMSQGTAMQSFYDLIDQAALTFHSDTNMDATDNVVASLNFKQYGLNEDQAIAVWVTYKNDHPLYYWISTTVSMTEKELFLLTEDAYDTGAERAVYNALVYGAVEEYLGDLQEETSNYRIALALHDAIIHAMDYAYEDDGVTPQDDIWAHNILGVFEKQSGVCESYARTFQLLLNFLDVENVFVTGKSNDQEHAWNLVQMDDGNWYWFDLTWDDTPTWMWGVSYDYFCVNDTQREQLRDGGGYASNKSFLETHTVSGPDGQGVGFLYGLPERSETVYSDDDPVLRDTFIVDGFEYSIVGYNAVALIHTTQEGDVVIPESVLYCGVIYEVIAIGGMDDEGLFDAIHAVCDEATTITIPKSVRFIWDCAFRNFKIENIYVSQENQYFTSVDGVLFTKHLYTLIQYPLANSRTEYVIPDEVSVIAANAFMSAYQLHLEKLTIGAGVEVIGQCNWGNDYPDGAAVGFRMYNLLSGELARIYRKLSGEKELLLNPDNPHFVIVDSAIYYSNMTTLHLIMDESLTSFHIPATVQSPISDEVFDLLPNLEEITVDVNNIVYFAEDGVLYKRINEYVSEIYYVPIAISGDVVLVDGITEIPRHIFWGCSDLTSVVIPEGVTSIGGAAFNYCKGLMTVVIPSSVTDIGYYAFDVSPYSLDIYYSGTEDEWKSIQKDELWISGDYVVHYNDNAPDPENGMDPVFLIDAPAMYDKATVIANNTINCLIAAAELRADDKYVSILGAGSDMYFAAIPMNSRVRAGRYLVIKYRTTEDCDGELFLGSGSAWTGVGDHVDLDYISDGEWHLLMIDLKNVEAVANSYVLGYLRVDCFTDGTDRMIDIAYIASFSSIEAAEAYDAQLGYEDVPYDATKPEKIENPGNMEDPVVPDGSGSYTVDMNKPANAGVYKPSFPEALIGNPVCLLGYGNTVYLGNLDLSNYSKVLISYSCDGTQVTADAFAAASSLDIGLKSSNSSFGQETDSNYDDAVAYTDMVFSEAGWHGAGVRTAEIDLSEITYSGNLWAAVHNPQGTMICIHSVMFIEG